MMLIAYVVGALATFCAYAYFEKTATVGEATLVAGFWMLFWPLVGVVVMGRFLVPCAEWLLNAIQGLRR